MVALKLSLNVADFLYTIFGNRNQNNIIIKNHNKELNKKAQGEIFLK